MSDDRFADLVPEHIAGLRAYQPGRPIEEVERELGITGVIKIASNENPMGPSPLAMEAAAKALSSVHFYPDGAAFHLRRELAARLGVAPERLVFGAGANELIYLLVQTFCRPGVDEVLTHQYAFVSYRLAATAHGSPFVEAPVTAELRCDVDALIGRMSERTRIVFLANPNNPTGAQLTRGELERVLEAAPARALVVVDEAYHEYARAADPEYPSSQDYAETRPLLVTLRTFSKIYGLAGLRVGYALCHERVAGYLERVRRPFNVNAVAQAAARAALADDAHVARSQKAAVEGIAALREALAGLGLVAYPSTANFVLAEVGRSGAEVTDALLRQGVIVRPMAAWGLPSCVRISIGTPAETERVVASLRAVLG